MGKEITHLSEMSDFWKCHLVKKNLKQFSKTCAVKPTNLHLKAAYHGSEFEGLPG